MLFAWRAPSPLPPLCTQPSLAAAGTRFKLPWTLSRPGEACATRRHPRHVWGSLPCLLHPCLCVDERLPASRLDGSVGALTPGTCTFVAYVCCHVCCHVCCQVVVAQYTLQNRAVHSAIQQALAANAVVEYDPHEGLFRLAGTVHSSLGACRPPATASHAACRPPLQGHSGVGRGGWVWMGGCLLTTSHALTRCRGARLFVCLLSCRLL